LVSWAASDFGLHQLDAYQLLSQVVESPLANVVDTNYSSLAKVRKAYLPDVAVYDDAHQRLRALAATYRTGRG
jgi:hypothetical protein